MTTKTVGSCIVTSLFALLLCCTPKPAFAAHTEALPKGLIGDHLRRYIEGVNRAQPLAVHNFVADDLSPKFDGPREAAALIPYFQNQRRVTGGIDPVSFQFDTGSNTKGSLVFLDRIYGGLRAIEFTFDPEAGEKIINFGPIPLPSWALSGAPNYTPNDIAAYARTLMDRGCQAGVFSGAFLVAYKGQPIFEDACGDADKQRHISNSVQTRFNIGSMNKMFTAVAVAQLIEKGRISINDKLSTFLDDDWLPKSISTQITIGELLSMTSGLGSYFDDGPIGRFRDNVTLDDFRPIMRAEKLLSRPGVRYEYSGTGYFLLGIALQKASGLDYYTYIRDNIYDPSGMRKTDSYDAAVSMNDVAVGYYIPTDTATWRSNTEWVPRKGSPDGGGYSTVGDLLNFATSLKARKILSKKSLSLIWTDSHSDSWGAGFYVFATPAGKIVGKDGFARGVSSEMDIYLDNGYVVVSLSNQESGALAPMDAMRAELAGAR